MDVLTDITLQEFINTVFFLLIGSLCLNIYLFVKQEKKPKTSIPESPVLQNKDFIQFIREQIAETKKQLKNAPNNKHLLDNKVITLRTAYLNIENKALDKKINSDNYFNVLNTGINRLIRLFLPQVYGQESHVHELENRITLLTERIKKLQIAPDKHHSLESAVSGITKIMPSIEHNHKTHAIIGQYMEKMENVISNYETTPKEKIRDQASQRIKNSISSMDNLHSSINLQNDEATRAEILISRLIEQSESGSSPDDLEMIVKLKEAQAEIREFKNKNLYLEKMVTKLKDRLSSLEEPERQDKVTPLITITGNTDDDDSEALEIDALANQVNDIAEREISRLREIQKKQDDSIHHLNTEIGKLRQKTNQSEKLEEFQEQTIKKLQSHAKESDNCIKTLEKEIDELHEELKNTNQSNKDSIYNDNDAEETKRYLDEIQLELQESLDKIKDHNRLLSYYNESVQANSAEDLAVVIFQNMEDMGCKPNMWLNANNREIHLSDNGAMSTREKVIINNMVLGETNLGHEGKSLKFRFKNIKGVLVSVTKDNIQSEFKDAIDFLRFIDQLSEKMFSKAGKEASAAKISAYARYLKLIANDVDQGIDTQIKSAKDLVETSFAQTLELLDSGSETSAIKNRLTSMHKNSMERLDSDDLLKLKLRKQFLEIIKSMEK